MKMIEIENEACPGCNSFGPNEANRPKVGDEDGTWWWKCYTPGCWVDYYNPETSEVERRNWVGASRGRENPLTSTVISPSSPDTPKIL